MHRLLSNSNCEYGETLKTNISNAMESHNLSTVIFPIFKDGQIFIEIPKEFVKGYQIEKDVPIILQNLSSGIFLKIMKIRFNDKREQWTSNRLTEELYLQLATAEDRNPKSRMMERKYYELAKSLIYRIPVYEPVPIFLVNRNDLGGQVKEEIESVGYSSCNDIMTHAIGMIFESVNQRYYLSSVKHLLRWDWK